jgi:hypothetical protein
VQEQAHQEDLARQVTLNYTSGKVYEGGLLHNKYQGVGTIYFPDGDVFVATYEQVCVHTISGRNT